MLAECGTAPGSSTVVYGLRHNRQRFLTMDLRASGMGAGDHGDGVDCTHFPANTCNTPAEIFESDTPFIVEKREISCDTGGAGRRRGGLGQEVVWRVRDDAYAPIPPVTVSTVMGRVRRSPQGLFGGKEGGKSRYQINGVDSEWGGLNQCKPGDVIRFCQPGGGGYGNPLEREPDRVARDVRNDYVSLASAREDYGVVIDPATLEVDEVATRQLRTEKLGAA